ncbi:hypothetical protein, partial [Alistipes putredinis]
NTITKITKLKTMKKILSILGVLFISLSASAQYKIGNYDLSTNSYFYRIPTAYALLSEDIEAHIGTIYLYFVQMQDKLPTIGVRLEYNGGVYKNFILIVESTEDGVLSAEDNSRVVKMNCTNEVNEKFTLKFGYTQELIQDKSETSVFLKGPLGIFFGTFQGIYDIRKVTESYESMRMMEQLMQSYREHYGL